MKRVLSLLAALVLILGLLPQIAGPAKAAASVDNLCYDDHVDMTGRTVQILDAGQGPVITLEGDYLVATGIGTAKVRIDGVTRQITVSKAKVNLIMIMGQSNAGNHFDNATSDVTCPLGTAYWWGNGQGTAATAPVDYTQPSMGFHTPLLAELYAQSVAAGDPVKNVLIWQEGITSKDGQSITKWASSATNTSGTDAAVTMLENCRAYYLANSDKFEIVSSGIYWLQGESDESMDPTKYTQCFMAMWQRLKNAGMEYVAFMRVRRNVYNSPANRDDLRHSASLSAQIKMINENPEFYMATRLTENWIGLPADTHTIDISNYITMLQAYGQKAVYTDSYGNTATYADGKLTTQMQYLFGANNICHYGKFGYGAIAADAAYHMYRAFHGQDAAILVTDTSGHADRVRVLKNGESMILDISGMTDDLSFRADCGSVSGTLKFVVRSAATAITGKTGVVISSGEKYGAVSVAALRDYENVSVTLTYTTAKGEVHTAVCYVQSSPAEPKQDYIWDFNGDLKARGADGEVLNSFLDKALLGSYTFENGYLTGQGLQLQLENAIELHPSRDWSIEWKYGSLENGTAGFLLCEDATNKVGNRALWHISRGSFAIADYADSSGYRNYTRADVLIQDHDTVKLTNSYDPITGKSTVSLWINGELRIDDFQLKGCINNYYDNKDMTIYPLVPDFVFRYLGNSGLSDWRMNCQLDYLKVSFGEVCTHSYTSEITTAATCEREGILTYVCSRCGDSYTEALPAKGHSYSSEVTQPTCTAQGYTTYTCAGCGDRYTGDYMAATGHQYVNGSCALCGSNCSHSYIAGITTAATCTASGVKTYTCSKCSYSYTEVISATGHRYASGKCTACGAADPSASQDTTYYLVGWINGADYGCESDWENMGSYKFVNKQLTVIFDQDSYVFVKTEGNGKWLLTERYCTDTTGTFVVGGSEKMFVPGNVQVTFTLVENADGSVTLSYVTGAQAVTKPTLTLKSPTLEFKDMITVNAFYTAENIQDVVEMGMITYSSKVSTVSVDTAEYIIPGATYVESSGRYYSCSQGIHAKYLGDTVYLAIYAKLKDGTYAYSKLAGYSAVQYATSQLKNSSDTKLKQLVVAMLNYGAEAQLYFGHNTSALANASLTAEQKALPAAYNSGMVSAVPSAPAEKQGSLVNNQGFASKKPAISFEGAFCINYFFTPNYAPDSGITLYYWNAADYNANSVLTAANATGSFKLEGSSTGEYRGDITGIAAKELSEAVYVAAAYKSGGTVWTSGVLGYSIGAYCASQASKGTAISNLAKATAVYGYQAKAYFG